MDVYTGSGIFFVRFIIRVFFLLRKASFSGSTFQALMTNKLQKGFAIDFCERSQKDQKKPVN